MLPMVDLKKQLLEIRDEINAHFEEILNSTTFILGPKLKELERRIAEYHSIDEGSSSCFAVGVASGTDALHLSLRASGIKEGDEVITTPFTFFATVEAIVYTGARPVFVDIDPETFNINPELIEEKVTPRTRAIVPVHLYGHPADMKKIMEIAKRYNLIVIEDCAQAFGARIFNYDNASAIGGESKSPFNSEKGVGRLVGTFGNAGCFSFYPSKNLGAYGDAGMVLTRDEEIASKVLMLRNHGSQVSYLHEEIGFNSRLDEFQAAVLLVKLKRIDRYNELRRKKALLYNSLLDREKVKVPVEREGYYHVYHQYTLRSPVRDTIQKRLREKEIASVVYYPVPLHLQKALNFLGYKKGDFPEAEKASEEVLSLPIYPELPDEVIERIAEVVNSV
jgi:dTDP-4-amino-4,6-dideoxygalactose transaminase